MSVVFFVPPLEASPLFPSPSEMKMKKSCPCTWSLGAEQGHNCCHFPVRTWKCVFTARRFDNMSLQLSVHTFRARCSAQKQGQHMPRTSVLSMTSQEIIEKKMICWERKRRRGSSLQCGGEEEEEEEDMERIDHFL